MQIPSKMRPDVLPAICIQPRRIQLNAHAQRNRNQLVATVGSPKQCQWRLFPGRDQLVTTRATRDQLVATNIFRYVHRLMHHRVSSNQNYHGCAARNNENSKQSSTNVVQRKLCARVFYCTENLHEMHKHQFHKINYVRNSLQQFLHEGSVHTFFYGFLHVQFA